MTITVNYDNVGGNAGQVTAIQFDGESLCSGAFVMIGESWFGRVGSPQLNLSKSGLPEGPQLWGQLELHVEGRYDRGIVIEYVRYYFIDLLADVSSGLAASVLIRPKIGDSIRLATAAEVAKHVGLPEPKEQTQIGSLVGVEVPLCLDSLRVLTHSLIAGSTGSGKTNTVASYVDVGHRHDMCVVILDHKPDFQDIDQKYGEKVMYLSLGRGKGEPLQVEACDLDPWVLAGVLFDERKDEIQYYAFASAMNDYNANGRWSYVQFFDHLSSMPLPRGTRQTSWDKLLRVANPTNGKVPGWINRGSGLLNRSNFNPALLERGKIFVVDVSQCNGRDYGLFASYFARLIQRSKADGSLTVPLMIVVDEAQDIFALERSEAGRSITENVRKGRSQQVGYVFSCQSAGNLPDDLRGQLNTQILHKHLNPENARAAVSVMTKEDIAKLRTFAPGEALVYMSGAMSSVHAKMNLSPFPLTVPKERMEW